MREKLFYLMTDSKCPAFFLNNEQVLALADYLVENGIVIPVRCGECVYLNEYGICELKCPIRFREQFVGKNDYCSHGKLEE